jgi:hypothetical protein
MVLLFRLPYFGVGFWKSCAVWLANYVLVVVPVGRKYIEQFGIIPLRQIIILLGRDLLIPGRPHAATTLPKTLKLIATLAKRQLRHRFISKNVVI